MPWAAGADGQTNATGYDVIITPDLFRMTMASHLAPLPITRVWSGDDDPANPTMTVQLLFVSDAAAKVSLPGLWRDDADVVP